MDWNWFRRSWKPCKWPGFHENQFRPDTGSSCRLSTVTAFSFEAFQAFYFFSEISQLKFIFEAKNYLCLNSLPDFYCLPCWDIFYS